MSQSARRWIVACVLLAAVSLATLAVRQPSDARPQSAPPERPPPERAPRGAARPLAVRELPAPGAPGDPELWLTLEEIDCKLAEKTSASIDTLLDVLQRQADPAGRAKIVTQLVALVARSDLERYSHCGWVADTRAEVDEALCRALAESPDDERLRALHAQYGRDCP